MGKRYRAFVRLALCSAPFLSVGSATAEPTQISRPNVLLISIDTLRSDHLASYGYSRETCPALTKLAGEGVRFENSYSQAPSTIPTHASMFTGRYPFLHGTYSMSNPLKLTELTVSEFLSAKGYSTFSVASSPRFRHRPGFAQGFDSYELVDELEKNLRSARVTDLALEHMQQGSPQPFFGFLHYFDPHIPYAPPEPFRSLWHPVLEELTPELSGFFAFTHRRPDNRVEPHILEYFRSLYDGAIYYMCEELQRLFDAIRGSPNARNTIVIVTSDHGEAFKEHGNMLHAEHLHEELLRVPLIVWWPGNTPAERVVRAPVQTVDLFPTIVELLGEQPPEGLVGRSRAALLVHSGEVDDTAPGAQNVLLAQGGPQTWAISATLDGRRFKYVAQSGASPVLYNLDEDPGGHRDVIKEYLAQASALEKIAREIGVIQAPAPSVIGEQREITPELREKLRALGYADEVDASQSPLASSPKE